MKLQNKILTNEEKIEIRAFLLGNPIIQVKEGVIKADESGTAIENAKKWAAIHTREIIRPDIGMVVFDGGGVKDSLGHGFNQRKLDAIQVVPEVIKSGKIVKISSDYSGKPQKNIIIMAPIRVGENKSILVIRLRKSIGDDTRFYVHEVVDITDVNKKGNTIRPSALDLTARPQGGIALYINILRDILNVKPSIQAPKNNKKSDPHD